MRAFVLLSGGIDSTTCLGMAIKEYGPENVTAVSFDYGQRHVKETNQAYDICQYYGVEHEVLKLGEQPGSMLTDARVAIPKMSYSDLPTGISPTYVPFRNGQMLSRIAAEAHAWCKANDWSDKEQNAVIYFGAHAEDAQNWAYPDCTPEFIGSMANAIFIGTYQRVRLVTPFIHSLKSTIVHDGWMLDVPYHLTWSCYAGGEVHCGECPTCIARKEAFTKGNIPDPTVYANTPIDMPHIGQAHDATADVPSDPDEIPF